MWCSGCWLSRGHNDRVRRYRIVSDYVKISSFERRDSPKIAPKWMAYAPDSPKASNPVTLDSIAPPAGLTGGCVFNIWYEFRIGPRGQTRSGPGTATTGPCPRPRAP